MAKEDHKGIWVFAEQEHGVLHPTVFELLAKAGELQSVCGETVTAVLLGSGVRPLAQELFDRGADEVILAENDALAGVQRKALSGRADAAWLRGTSPPSSSSERRRWAGTWPRGSWSRWIRASQPDAIDLSFDEDGVFCQTTPAYGGKILAHIAIPERRPQMVTVHPQICRPREPVPGSAECA